jgi:hypothetical protein
MPPAYTVVVVAVVVPDPGEEQQIRLNAIAIETAQRCNVFLIVASPDCYIGE